MGFNASEYIDHHRLKSILFKFDVWLRITSRYNFGRVVIWQLKHHLFFKFKNFIWFLFTAVIKTFGTIACLFHIAICPCSPKSRFCVTTSDTNQYGATCVLQQMDDVGLQRNGRTLEWCMVGNQFDGNEFGLLRDFYLLSVIIIVRDFYIANTCMDLRKVYEPIKHTSRVKIVRKISQERCKLLFDALALNKINLEPIFTQDRCFCNV